MTERILNIEMTSLDSLLSRADNVEEVIKIQDGLDPEYLAFPCSISSSPALLLTSHFAYINNIRAANGRLRTRSQLDSMTTVLSVR